MVIAIVIQNIFELDDFASIVVYVMAGIQTFRTYNARLNNRESAPAQVDVVVIGGGATGVGAAYDLAQRGFSVALLEKNELGAGTSGHFHGMLHSGARYAIDDLETAALCMKENQILRRIAGTAVKNTGGYFLALNGKEVDYAERLIGACRDAGIPVNKIDAAEIIHREPAIAPATRIKYAVHVPDGSIDSKGLLALNRQAAERAKSPPVFLTHHEVMSFHRKAGRIDAVTVRDGLTQEVMTVGCNYVVNAAGVWANVISQLAGVTIELVWDKGSMVVLEQCYTRTVINRCRPQADGDIIVPLNGNSIVGTTSTRTDDIDAPRVEQWEIRALLQEASELVPAIGHAKVRFAYAGVRPLLGSGSLGISDRTISRSFRVIDHAEDGVENFISIVGGKLTIYRHMAEVAADLICRKENVYRPCRTSELNLTETDPKPEAVRL